MITENSGHSDVPDRTARTAQEIRQWMITQISDELHVNPETVTCDQPILSSGIDSLQVVSIVARLEDWPGVRFSGNPLEDYSSIDDLSHYAASMKSGGGSAERFENIQD